MLTVYGIETSNKSNSIRISNSEVATVLTVYGIETEQGSVNAHTIYSMVATVLTVYGIETSIRVCTSFHLPRRCNSAYRLRY